jgi:GT2 family glycosyltransferase/2-polyprenyl-3-methyl-5-hydroxy-6-metoxy-1,4-benzoquinol methylase/glycosyltransferase involved in cell wall biosynthesis
MTSNDVPLHVYRREISSTEPTSLSVIAGIIPAGSSVLDLGTGSGALGRHLSGQHACVVDGVTLNEAEAELARPHYRRIEVADLERAPLAELFRGEAYDCIVCADVLEHLKQPERVLRACRELLSPGGKVLISVPNAAYCGLIAELLQGDFEYRPEGLLDRTHLRFFTRRSLGRFLEAEGWCLQSLQAVTRPLTESEFRVPFDQLPPAVSRHLLAIPDALTYQLVASVGLQPAAAAGGSASPPPETVGQALFSAELFLGHRGNYTQPGKQVATGVIGQSRQTVCFRWGEEVAPWSALRLDPADRAGFLHLYRITLKDADGATLWQWRCGVDDFSLLVTAPAQQLLLRPPWPDGAPALALLHGDDPWIELPIDAAALAARGERRAGSVEVELGWPMSADYLALKDVAQPLADRLSHVEPALIEQSAARERLELELATHREELKTAVERSEHQRQMLEQQGIRLHVLEDNERKLLDQREHLLAQKHRLADEKRELQRSHLKLRSDFDGLFGYVQRIEQSKSFRMTRPLSRLKGRIDTLLGRPSLAHPPAPVRVAATPMSPTSWPIDVIVPVYRGLADTQRCLRSVLSSTNTSAFRLIVINDASPEPEVTAWLRELQQHDKRVVLVENELNLGFVATVNRGMAMSEAHDVILLNSDTEVAHDWLDRLKRAAYSDTRVGTVTPFSNNATICSYPRFCESNALPEGCDTASLDALFARTLAGQTVDVPTGNGFCMYVRRDCLAQVGLFDVEHFGKGYGEENDFCQRALEAGWRNLHALDTFVLHSGGVSFGASKSARELAAMETLRRLHPHYEPQVHRFIALDPARPARQAVDLARVAAAAKPVVLLVMHDREGGTLRHMHELADRCSREAVFFVLKPAPGPSVQLELWGASEAFHLSFRLPSEFAALVEALRGLGVGHVHFHHLLGHTADVLALPAHLGVRYDFTAHDYHAFCPQISLTGSDNAYCGEEGPDQCRTCLTRSPAPGGVTIEQWRATHGSLVAGARHVLVPSHDAALRFVRYAPSADVRYAPHHDLLPPVSHPSPMPRRLAPDAALKVVVIGALSPIKGADVLEDVATLAARESAPLDFHLLGFAYRSLRAQPGARLTVHGQYDEADLPRLLDQLQPDLVWFPAQWPETYSYTLSACLERGLPVVATDLGAFAERLSGRAWSWIHPWTATGPEWLAFLVRLRERHFATGQAPAPTHRLQVISNDPRVLPWSYERDYLAGVRSPDRAVSLSPDFLAAHQRDRADGVEALRRGFKQALFMAVLRLRSAPLFSRLARSIPLRWQTRIKTWLRA